MSPQALPRRRTEPWSDISRALERSFSWAEERQYSGIDPYDALKSRLLAGLPPVLRFVGTQILKRLPMDIRPMLGISPGRNPKAIALFLSAAARTGQVERTRMLSRMLLSLRSGQHSHSCWGYDFPWQGRAFYLPAGTPTAVVTSFAGEALLDAHALLDDEVLLDDTLRFAARAADTGVDVTLHVEPAGFHVYPYFVPDAPESRFTIRRMGEFIRHHG